MSSNIVDNQSIGFPSRVEIDLTALAGNVRLIKAIIGDKVSLMAVVKSNAYGHGAAEVALTALQNGADMLAVANLAEAAELRAAGLSAPILALSYVPVELIAQAIRLDICVTVYDLAIAQQYENVAANMDCKLRAQVKVDSGMGRLGVLLDDAPALCERLSAMAGIQLEGIYTHFSSADEDAGYTAVQLARLNRLLYTLQSSGIEFKYIHAANSAAVITCPDGFFNVARPGLLLYGLRPALDSALLDGLRPALSWKTTVAQVKTLPAGSPVGYGNAYRTRGIETIAVLPVGYADGLRRSPRIWRDVLIHGVRAPLVGRVSMEKTTINVSHIPDVMTGDEVVLLGAQGEDEISADEIADWIGSINYEVVTSIAPRIPRRYV